MSLWPVLGAAVLGKTANRITLPSGGTYLLPEGVFAIRTGVYITLQQYDAISGIWVRSGGGGPRGSRGGVDLIYSDGQNYRLDRVERFQPEFAIIVIAGRDGACDSVVGALLTNGGSGYTSPPAVAPSAGGSIFKAIVGGAVSTSVTVNAAWTSAPMCSRTPGTSRTR